MKRFWDNAVLLLGTGLGIGWIPVAPGTFGTLWGLPLVWGIQQFPLPIQCLVIIGLFIIGIPICGRSAKLMGTDDPGGVVFDEIAAMPIVFLVTPLTWPTAIFGFLWFRVFDILKPPPASRLEKMHGGLGIMADDSMAGIYAAVALWGTAKIWGLETLV
ncbi:Phosphatidylglycerophosphatase A [Symmachiella dynata]|uniref:Phosphatidylglycerophosphatase A n=1 Tax=Symmachiella dynata TaxID=2527995 RepID=A0A517ZPM0_9PLAN|nr:Phosphatidylglycerophosphatase A [Symmachiella dynata]QDU44418.1 Phosphatidylglycerophosphatase A [Symmachiella dynata]